MSSEDEGSDQRERERGDKRVGSFQGGCLPLRPGCGQTDCLSPQIQGGWLCGQGGSFVIDRIRGKERARLGQRFHASRNPLNHLKTQSTARF